MTSHEEITQFGSLASRCDRLLYYNRWLTRALLALVVLFVVAFFVGARSATRFQVVSTRELQLVDDDGTVRCVLTLVPDTESNGKTVVFSLKDQQGADRVELATRPSGLSGLSFRDRTGSIRMTLVALPDGKSSLTQVDDLGRECLGLGTMRDTLGFEATAYTEHEAIRVGLGARTMGSSGLWITKSNTNEFLKSLRKSDSKVVVPGAQLLSLTALANGQSALRMWDGEQKQRVRLEVDSGSRARVELLSRGQAPGVSMEVTADGQKNISSLGQVRSSVTVQPDSRSASSR